MYQGESLEIPGKSGESPRAKVLQKWGIPIGCGMTGLGRGDPGWHRGGSQLVQLSLAGRGDPSWCRAILAGRGGPQRAEASRRW